MRDHVDERRLAALDDVDGALESRTQVLRVRDGALGVDAEAAREPGEVHTRVGNDVADVGAEVTVQVKKIDREARRVALSIKATQPDPWVEEAAQLRIGQVLDVEVVRFLAFGAIVRISERLEGLVHISEIAEERIAKPDDVLTLGQKVKATLLKKDLEGKKLGLSIVRAKRDQEKAEYRSYLNNNKGLTVDLSEQFKHD